MMYPEATHDAMCAGHARRPSSMPAPARKQQHFLTVPFLVVCIAAVGLLDLVTDSELTFTPFYVLVVVYAARAIGRNGSIFAALACAATGVLADYLMSEPFLTFSTSYELWQAPWWNGLGRLVVYLLVGLTVAKLHTVVDELQVALAHARTLQGLLPICAWCKRIRDEEHGECWVPLEQYVSQRTPAEFTHGICPGCAGGLRREALEKQTKK